MIDYKIGEDIKKNYFEEKKQNTSEYERTLNNNIFQTTVYRLNRDEYERTNSKIKQYKTTNFWLAIIAMCCTVNTIILVFLFKILNDTITNLSNLLTY